MNNQPQSNLQPTGLSFNVLEIIKRLESLYSKHKVNFVEKPYIPFNIPLSVDLNKNKFSETIHHSL